MLRRFWVYQFHNTSFTSRMRQTWSVGDTILKEDGANVASLLHSLKTSPELAPYYARIVTTIRQSLPFFEDFELNAEYDQVMLRWRERGSDQVFEAHQASDGMLRFIALVTMLLQPRDRLPDVLILDEPELGLHPHAITTVAGLVKSVAMHKQIILATQSTAFLNEFEPEQIVVVERQGRESIFKRLSQPDLSSWLERYTIAELWDKNVIGGRPA